MTVVSDVGGSVTHERGKVVLTLGDVETAMTPEIAQKLSFVLQRHAWKAQKGYNVQSNAE